MIGVAFIPGFLSDRLKAAFGAERSGAGALSVLGCRED